MDMDQSAVWLAGSILTMLGLVVVVTGIVIINNIIHKYWKPVKIFTDDSFSPFGVGASQTRFMTQEEYAKITPTMGEYPKDSDTKNVDLSKNR